MLKELIWVVLLTFTPVLELRGSIPYGLFVAKLNWPLVFIAAAISNILVGPIFYFIIGHFIHLFLKISLFKRIWEKIIERTQRNVHNSVEKYGKWGLAIFIGIPLPGTGVYSGAIAAYLLGMSYKEFLKSVIIGVLMAAIIVMAVSISGNEAFSLFVKKV